MPTEYSVYDVSAQGDVLATFQAAQAKINSDVQAIEITDAGSATAAVQHAQQILDTAEADAKTAAQAAQAAEGAEGAEDTEAQVEQANKAASKAFLGAALATKIAKAVQRFYDAPAAAAQ